MVLMVHTDIRERDLQDHLTIEMGRPFTDDELRKATGLSRRGWRKRNGADDFPSPNELESVAAHFGLDYINLLAEFGHAPAVMSRRVQALLTAQELPPL
jgi:hypothetical protein